MLGKSKNFGKIKYKKHSEKKRQYFINIKNTKNA